MNSPDEKALVERAKTDREAFGELYEKYFDQLYHYFYYRTGDQDGCYDLVSTTFERLITALPKYQEKDSVPFEAWLFRLAHNILVDHLRRENKRDYICLDDISPETVAEGTDVAQQTLASLQAASIKKVMHELPERYREVLYHKFFDEFTNPEIARLLGRKTEQIALDIHRGLKALQKLVVAQPGGIQ